MTAPAWVPLLGSKEPLYSADFANDRYFAHGGVMDDVDHFIDEMKVVYERDSEGSYLDAAGVRKFVGSNVPRLTHQGDGTPLGLLMEEERTNLIPYSSNFSGSGWAAGNVTVTPNAAVAPDGTTTAARITETTGNGWHEAYFDIASTVQNDHYAVSLSVDAGTRQHAWVWGTRGGPNYRTAIDGANKACGTALSDTGASALQSFMEALPNGWCRGGVAGAMITPTATFADIALMKDAAVTISIASPAVVTWPGHGLANGKYIYFDTTGALPSGLVRDSYYFVKNSTANTFELALTAGGASINTTGSQSGVHVAFAPFYAGDTGKYLDVAEAQFEKGRFPTSYIRTNGATKARKKDKWNRKYSTTVQDFTRVIKFKTAPAKPASGEFQVLSHLDNNRSTASGFYCDAETYRDSAGHFIVCSTYNTALTTIDMGALADGSIHTIAYSVTPAGIVASLDGAAAQSVALANPFPTDLFNDNLGHNMDFGRHWNGTILSDTVILEAGSASDVQSLSS